MHEEEVGCERACSAGWEGEGAGEGDRDRETLFMPARCCVCARAPTCELSSVETVRSSIPPSSRRPDGRACGRLHVADGYTTRIYTYRRPGYTHGTYTSQTRPV